MFCECWHLAFWKGLRVGCEGTRVQDREGCDESTEVVTDSLTPLLRPEAQGGEDEGCTWKDLALLGPFLFLTL